ncbi:hypothetical protein P3S67_016888 [Capsicum chacoense]
MMAVLNRVALQLKTLSKPIASGLNPKFQRFISETALRHRGEINMAKAGYLDKAVSSLLSTCFYTMVGLFFINDYRKSWKRDVELEALREVHQERFARDWRRFPYAIFPWVVYPSTTASLHPDLCSLYIKSTRLIREKYS